MNIVVTMMRRLASNGCRFSVFHFYSVATLEWSRITNKHVYVSFSKFPPPAAPGGEDCLGPEALNQSRVCNQVACRDFLWQVSAWSSCQPPGGTTSDDCSNDTGVRTRQVLCQKDPGKRKYIQLVPYPMSPLCSLPLCYWGRGTIWNLDYHSGHSYNIELCQIYLSNQIKSSLFLISTEQIFTQI